MSMQSRIEKSNQIIVRDKDYQKLNEWIEKNNLTLEQLTQEYRPVLTKGVLCFPPVNDISVMEVWYSYAFFQDFEDRIEYEYYMLRSDTETVHIKLDITWDRVTYKVLTKSADFSAAIEKYSKPVLEKLSAYIIKTHLLVMNYMEKYQEERELVRKESIPLPSPPLKSKRQQRKKNRRPVERIIYYLNLDSTSDVKKSHQVQERKFERHVDSWTVRGHWRTIKKTGKRIWVKEHVKGTRDESGSVYTFRR